MNRERAIEKEIKLLLRRHNKVANAKLSIANVQIPDNILDILCSTTQRNEQQKKLLDRFRAEMVSMLLEESNQIHAERLEKARRTREINLAKDPRFVRHFGTWVNTTLPSSKISRETYAAIDNRSTTISKNYYYQMIGKGPASSVYIDEVDGSIRYSKEWCLKHQQHCLQNFDMNMKKFQELNHQEFDKVLQKFVKGRKFQEVYSLDNPLCTESPWNDESCIIGFVYIMVLDEYKQVYIGITQNTVQKRIQQHWKKKKAFDRLLWGSVKDSVLSIDSFGPLDTTRLYVKPYLEEYKTPLEKYEEKCIKAFSDQYLLNRMK